MGAQIGEGLSRCHGVIPALVRCDLAGERMSVAYTAAADSPESVAAARDAIKAIRITVATEVVGRLGVTIGFSDADGDSSG